MKVLLLLLSFVLFCSVPLSAKSKSDAAPTGYLVVFKQLNGVNDSDNYSYIIMGDKLTVATWAGDDTPMGEGPHKLVTGDKCYQLNPETGFFYNYTEYLVDPDQLKKGLKAYPAYLKKLAKKFNGFIDQLKLKPSGKKTTIAGFQCDGYTGMNSVGGEIELYFSKDPKLASLIKNIEKKCKGMAKEILMTALRVHPKYGVLMKSGCITQVDDVQVDDEIINWGSEFEMQTVGELEMDPEMFTLEGYSEVPGKK